MKICRQIVQKILTFQLFQFLQDCLALPESRSQASLPTTTVTLSALPSQIPDISEQILWILRCKDLK